MFPYLPSLKVQKFGKNLSSMFRTLMPRHITSMIWKWKKFINLRRNKWKYLTKSKLVHYSLILGNKMLLWHGSRLTNYVGILSKGLKIAPLEAPSTGYMFGKGVYFADMVSKSANYCLASKINNVGLVLLCEVALGNIN